MDLAREVQVYSDSTQVSYLSPSPDHECEYVEQEGSLTIPRSGSTDDGEYLLHVATKLYTIAA